MTNYQISDLLIRIKNASNARRKTVFLTYSKMNKAICDVLVKNKFLTSVKQEEQDGKNILTATIRYEKRIPAITDVKIISKPSLRVYVKAQTVPKRFRKGTGISVMSTNKGILTDQEAVKEEVGGELLFKIW
ncbi:MAG: 30S ribosomal protein S8 [Candidatus Levybacteria bacterium]|nr:30S ribosomal protein S8 [Candidatus Levybacteria bacterium]